MNAELRDLLRRAPWALQPEALASLTRQVLEGRHPPAVMAARGADTDPWWMSANSSAAEPPTTDTLATITTTGSRATLLTNAPAAAQGSAPTSWKVALLPLDGLLMHTISWWGTSLKDWREELLELAADSSVNGIIIPIYSPGGSIYGLPEAADVVYGLRGIKPVVALVNPLAASAAYWIASQAERIVITPSGDAGSVGVWMSHWDESRFWDEMGVTISLISAGKYKVEGNPWQPLGDEARAAMQEDVDRSYADFLAAVARGRGVNTATVKRDFGEGRVLDAEESLAAGMVDQIGLLEDAVDQVLRLGGQSPAIRGNACAEEVPLEPLTATPTDAVEPPIATADTAPSTGAAAGVTEPSLVREWLQTQELLRRRRDG